MSDFVPGRPRELHGQGVVGFMTGVVWFAFVFALVVGVVLGVTGS